VYEKAQGGIPLLHEMPSMTSRIIQRQILD
jgi:hypothetical protein